MAATDRSIVTGDAFQKEYSTKVRWSFKLKRNLTTVEAGGRVTLKISTVRSVISPGEISLFQAYLLENICH